MKILILGGYGIFGARLCRLLATEARLSLFIAGRSMARASELCRELPSGAERTPLSIDRTQPLQTVLERIAPDVLIDATGPFQLYGDDPYRVIEACLAADVNYMDFADGSAFVSGVARFNEAARAKGLYVLSGVSSFPVLTAAVVRRLGKGMTRVSAIRGGIAPSPYAGVGPNVIRAIAAYAGKELPMKRDGRATHGHAMTDATCYTISPPGRLPLRSTRFSLVDVPDLQVLPELFPEAQTVWMGAGPVPEIWHRLLNGLAWLVRWRLVSSLSALAPLFHWVINHVRWGEHRGGMFVEVDGTGFDGGRLQRSWHMVAEGEDGPYIPCMALEAIVRRGLQGTLPPPGARPASQDLELDDYERLFAVRNIVTGQREENDLTARQRLFPRLLGGAWAALPPALRQVHDGASALQLKGEAEVERGRGWLANAVARVMGFPAAGQNVPVDISMVASADCEIWLRTIGGQSFSSQMTAGKGRADRLLIERFGPVSVGMALVVRDGQLHFVVRRWNVLGLPLPVSWAPGGRSLEHAEDGRFHFDVEIAQPWIGTIVKYKGWVECRD